MGTKEIYYDRDRQRKTLRDRERQRETERDRTRKKRQGAKKK